MDIARTILPTIDHVDDLSWLGSQHGLETGLPVTLDPTLFTSTEHYPQGWFRSGTPLGKVTSTGFYGPYSGGTTDEVQLITITGSPTGGTYTLTFSGQTTAAIAFNAAASVVQTALGNLSNIGSGNVTVTGNAGGPYTVNFVGSLANTNTAQMTATSSLTGGSSPAVTPATTTSGGQDASADGRDTLAGFLYGMVKPHVKQDLTVDTTVKIGATLLVPYRVRLANLPIPVDANGQADLAGRTTFI